MRIETVTKFVITLDPMEADLLSRGLRACGKPDHWDKMDDVERTEFAETRKRETEMAEAFLQELDVALGKALPF